VLLFSPVRISLLKSAKCDFLDIGAAYGTYRSGVGIGSIGVTKPELIMKSIIPVVMAGILGIYGMIVSVIMLQKSKFPPSHLPPIASLSTHYKLVWLQASFEADEYKKIFWTGYRKKIILYNHFTL